MTIDDRNIIWLDLFSFLTYQKKVKILSLFDKNTDIKPVFASHPHIKEILSQEEINKMQLLTEDASLTAEIEKFTRDGIVMLTINSSDYPDLLRQTPYPPLCLYCKGNMQLLNTTSVAIVGSRKPTEYGIVVAKQYAKELSNVGLTIVSGMAVGVDTIAHRTALQEQGNTIAVLAGGLYNIYPMSNISLYREIIENNLVISENSPNTPPLSFLFPIRNRIIAGLSKATVVVEAGDKSGSLKTANLASDYNRDVFAVPGRITAPTSKGTNWLIKTNTASITLSPDDVLESLHITKETTKSCDIQLDIKAQIVLDYIKTEKHTFQEIADFTQQKTNELNALLMQLEMEGLIIKLASNSYIMA